MTDSTMEEEDLARLAVGGRAMRRQRLSRRLLARMLGARDEGDYESEEGDDEFEDSGGDQERRLARLLVGSRILRQRRLRRLMLAHLLRERGEADDTDSDDEMGAEGEEGEGKERQLIRLLVGSRIMRRNRVRRALLAHLLSERGEADDEDTDDETADAEEGEGGERKLVRLLIGSRILRRRRVRRALLAHLVRERGEAEDEDVEGDEETADDGAGRERRIIRLLIGSRLLRRRRARRALLAHLLREREEEA
jgi:hypothetical protein